MKNCRTMTEIRAEIDRIDQVIAPLLVERLHYIAQAGHIKADRGAVRDEWRIEDVVTKVRDAAIKAGGNPDYVEDIYRHLIDWSIAHEFVVWDSANVKNGTSD